MKTRSVIIFSILMLSICSQTWAWELHKEMNAFASRLHQKFDAKISTDESDFEWSSPLFSQKVVTIEGIGKVTYYLSTVGAIRSHQIESDKFYFSFYNDRHYPVHEIKISDLNLEIEIYDDRSGTFVKRDGWEYTNAGIEILGSGLVSDAGLDTLWISNNNFFISGGTGNGKPIAGIGDRYLTVWNQLNPGKYNNCLGLLCAYPNDHEQLALICQELGISPSRISWKEISSMAIAWLEKNVLAFLD